MINIKSKQELEKMRAAGKITGLALVEISKHIKPGVTTAHLDKIAYDFIKKHGAEPSFLNYNGFPASICASVNDSVVHGIPSKDTVLKEGDIVSIDVGANIFGYHGDAARTYAVGKISEEAQRLIDVTKKSFFEGIKCARHGGKLGAFLGEAEITLPCLPLSLPESTTTVSPLLTCNVFIVSVLLTVLREPGRGSW